MSKIISSQNSVLKTYQNSNEYIEKDSIENANPVSRKGGTMRLLPLKALVLVLISFGEIMKNMWLAIGMAMSLFASSVFADTIMTLCDNCDELSYTQVADSYTEVHGVSGDYVLITDLGNQMQRKYLYNGSSITPVSLTQEDVDILLLAITVEEAFAGVGIEGYCGPGSIGALGIFDGPDSAFSAACEAHDVCYLAGGSESDRTVCDYAFYWDLRLGAGSRYTSVIYFSAVRRAGANFFNYGNGGSGWYCCGGYYGGSSGGIWGNSYIDPSSGIIPLLPPPPFPYLGWWEEP